MNCCRYGCGAAPVSAVVWRTPLGRNLVLGCCEAHQPPKPPPGWSQVDSGDLHAVAAAWANIN